MPSPVEMLSRLPRPVRMGLYAAAALVLLYMALAPARDVPGVELLWDKAEHAAAWSVLTLLGLLLSTRRRWAILVFALAFGGVIEVLQAILPFGPRRGVGRLRRRRRGDRGRLFPVACRAASGLGEVSPRHTPWEESSDFRIGLGPIATEAWLEGGEAHPAARKDPLFADARGLVWAETEGSRPAQAEALAMVEAVLGPDPPVPEDLPPLYAAARRTPDDLCLMEKRDGQWRLTALSLSAGSFFTAGEAIGKSLRELHGPVTGFAERFLVRVQRIFEGLRPELVLERRNWTLLNSDALHTPTPGPIRARIGEIAPAEAARALHLRVERQTLRRLPQTGAALFTIRVWLAPLESLAGDPARLAAFARAWADAPAAFRAYKRLDLYDGLVADFLARSGAVDAR